MGWGKGNVASGAVLYGPSIILALNDAMWAKYKLGDAFGLKDASGKGETANVYYKAQTAMSFDGDPGAGGNVYQDWSGEACIKRGSSFFVCHNALTAFGGMTGMQMGMDPGAVVAEWKANLLPGYMIVPAGVGALHLAMENGWKMLPLI
jgi:intracellular sulfur oxidation DsrE/DsrF family protein